MILKEVKQREDADSKKLAEAVFSKFISRSVKMKKITEEFSNSQLPNAISLLERHAKIYVERFPSIVDDALRTDYRPMDVVHFACFPSTNRRTLLYRTAVEYGNFTINHILGCSHGCQYPCYAMQLSKRYGRVKDREGWMHPKIVNNALLLLEKEIPKYRNEIQFVHLSFMTDPFMYDPVNRRNNPWIQKLTLRIIEKLNKSDLKATVLTKSQFPDDLVDERFSQDNEYGITLVSMDKEFHRRYEPFSISPSRRLRSLERLHKSGLKTWVSVEPYPTPNIVRQDLENLLEKLSFVDKMIFGKWNYNPAVNRYAETNEFYTKCSNLVIDFCKENDIALHIKKHTPRSNDTSENLFIKT